MAPEWAQEVPRPRRAAGIAAGYFLPVGSPPASETSAANETAAPASVNGASAQASQVLFQEFALPAADLRDTQQAPSLAIGSEGQVYVCWESKTDDTTKALMFTTAPNARAALDEPRAIAQSGIFKSGGGARGGHERRMLPRLASYSGKVAVAWSDAPPDGASVRMLLAESHDQGRSFAEPAVIHASAEARPTFISMAANSKGQIAASWLDCRSGPQQVFAAVRPAADSAFLLDTVVFAGQNDQGVCPCCPTASLVTDDGIVLVAFRSQIDGYRDTWISRFDPQIDKAFSQPLPVVPPTWKFDGCPHDGPALAVTRQWLHVAWMDAHTGPQRAYYGRAKLSDLKRGQPQFEVQELHAQGPGTQANVKLAADGAGGLHAVWEESLADEPPAADVGPAHQHGPPTGAGRAIMYAHAPANGRLGPAQAIKPQPGRFQTRPNIACGPAGQLVIAWTELDESGKRIVIARQQLKQRLALNQ